MYLHLMTLLAEEDSLMLRLNVDLETPAKTNLQKRTVSFCPKQAIKKYCLDADRKWKPVGGGYTCHPLVAKANMGGATVRYVTADANESDP